MATAATAQIPDHAINLALAKEWITGVQIEWAVERAAEANDREVAEVWGRALDVDLLALVIDPSLKKGVKSAGAARETPAEMQARRGMRGGLTVVELAIETGWSKSTLRRMFLNEPGVSRIVHKETQKRRGYVCLRIPRHVADRVLTRLARK
jgi:hypothetical protein